MASSIAQLNPEGGLPGHIEDLYAIQGEIIQCIGKVSRRVVPEDQVVAFSKKD